jgi:hypothetical protein
MASVPIARTRKAKKSAILGVTRDGVAILRPRYKATHFTAAEIKLAVLKAKELIDAE